MNAAMANARIFTRTTLMPAPAADRSFARTASMAEPSRLRRSNATDTATITSTPSTRRQNCEAWVVGADARTEIEPEELRAADVPAFGRHVVGVVEPHGLHRVGHGERHHGDEQATDADRREADDHTDDRCAERSEDRRDRERDRPFRRHRREQETGDAGEGELRERHLPGVAGHDDERQADDREDEARDQRGSPVVLQQDQRDRAGNRSQHRGREDALRARRSTERALQDDAATRERLGAHDEDQEDQHERDELGEAGAGQPRVLAPEVRHLRLQHADEEPTEHRGDDVLETAEHRGGERGNDEERVGDRGRAARWAR